MAKTYDGKELKVGGALYTISEVEGLHRKYELFGQVSYADCVIEIDAGLSDERKEQVVTHELLHAMLFEAGYLDQDEELVHRLSNVLHVTLADNYDILATPEEEDSILGEEPVAHTVTTNIINVTNDVAVEEVAEALRKQAEKQVRTKGAPF